MNRWRYTPPGRARSVSIITETGGFGGTEAHTIALMELLARRGYEMTLVECSHQFYDSHIADRGLGGCVRIQQTPLRPGFGADLRPLPPQWKALMQDLDGQVLLLPKGFNDMGNLSFHRLCRKRFSKFIVIEHLEADPPVRASPQRLLGTIPLGIDLDWHRARIVKKLKSSCADRTIAVSQRVKDRLTQDWQIAPDRIAVVRNGIMWHRYARDASLGAAFRRRHAIAPDAFVIGMMSRLSIQKAIDLALRAFKRLGVSPPGRSVCLVIAGTGPLELELKALAESLGVSEQVRFVGFVPKPIEALSAYDVILFSSRQEGLPLGLLEGMAAGCVPIVTRISGMPEVVDSPQLGWTAEPENPGSLAHAMQCALQCEPAKFDAMRELGRQRVRDHFDIAQSHRKILDICEL